MTCDCTTAIQYIIEARNYNISLMESADEAEVFFFYKGKVYAFNEMLRVFEDD